MSSAAGRPAEGLRRRQPAPPAPVRLSDLLHRLERRLGRVTGPVPCDSVAIAQVRYDHRMVRRPEPGGAGDLFCCLPGEHRDGHDFAREARRRGAVAFLCERDLGAGAGGAPQLVVGPGRARAAMAEAACALYGDPAERLVTVGITGTNGKTTTAYLVGAILAAAGYETTVIGTLSGTRTTPESPDLQRELAAAAAAAADAARPGAVALEATSHALVQHRVDGYVHDVAVFTNLSQDHLDFHKTMEAYFEAKALLFGPEHARRAVVNGDDPYGRRLAARAEVPTEVFGLADAEQLEIVGDGSRFLLRGHRVHLRLVGRVNVENALAAAAAARAIGVDDETVASALSQAGGVPGRFEQVPNALGLAVVVDYAHTPVGLGRACAELRELVPEGRLVVVFGAGGDRDRQKRAQMGHAVSVAADVAVVTSDNPRHEDPLGIIAEVVSGCDGSAELHVEPDRRLAIGLGLSLARAGDLVLVAGKGHETTQQVGDVLVEFDDRVVVAEEASRLAGAA
ncbi:MAG TPA: UDP-N-acetylmuramoyl-L-alanyl-D-glutamate--2,6-diaminopimelate ligase [Acidimicrobiales bacterium]|nr:UDP-N-acetylmuramoyl-L-alanyl-D-glutamate--2,6-diaminopimelate ligase [Acidimicrobiales bacterium]